MQQIACFHSQVLELSTVTIMAVLPLRSNSERGMCFQNFPSYLSLLPSFGNIPHNNGVQRFATGNLKTVSHNGLPYVKSNTWDWKRIICNNFFLFKFFRTLPKVLLWPHTYVYIKCPPVVTPSVLSLTLLNAEQFKLIINMFVSFFSFFTYF